MQSNLNSMNLMYLIPIILAVLLSVVVLLRKNKNPIVKSQHTLQIVGFICCIFAIVAIIISYYYSGDNTQLYKLVLPAMIIMIFVQTRKKNRE
jgi:uncharacterized membrane protein